MGVIAFANVRITIAVAVVTTADTDADDIPVVISHRAIQYDS